jgi:hypothetical protein
MTAFDRTQDPATEPKQAEKSVGELFGELTADFGHLMRQELELAKVETRQQIGRSAKAAGMFGGAGLGSWMAALFLSFALAWLLDQEMNQALAFAIVGAAWAIVAAVMFAAGKRAAKLIEPLPETTKTLKEDVQWAQAQKN